MTRALLRNTTAAVAIASALLVSACGDDDSEAIDSATATEGTDEGAYCQAMFDLTAASDEDLGIDPETASEEEIAEAAQQFFASDPAREYAEVARRHAPEPVREDSENLVAALLQYGEDGDIDAAEAAIGDSQDAVDTYLETNCPDIEK